MNARQLAEIWKQAVIAKEELSKLIDMFTVWADEWPDELVAVENPVSHVELWVDGGLHGPNPGSPLYGSYAFGDVKETVEFGITGTNNEAEYHALIIGLGAVGATCDPATVALTVKTDSELVRSQVLGEWKIKAEHLRGLCDKARCLLAEFASWKISHVPRTRVVSRLGH